MGFPLPRPLSGSGTAHLQGHLESVGHCLCEERRKTKKGDSRLGVRGGSGKILSMDNRSGGGGIPSGSAHASPHSTRYSGK